MDRAEDEVDGGVGGEGVDEGSVGGPDPFAFEADEDVELGGVLRAQAEGFGDVGVVVGVCGVDSVAGCYLVKLGGFI